MVVGLRSVAQLSLDGHISGFRTMTEVYNLIEIGRINNHLSISQKQVGGAIQSLDGTSFLSAMVNKTVNKALF